MYNDYDRLSRMLDIDALQQCNSGYIDAEDCSWYHKNWVKLRQLGLVSNPFWHEQFFLQQLKKYALFPNNKILVLGTADFSMPYLSMLAGIDELSISDICLTPLNICNFIAKKEGYKWNTFVGDIRESFDHQFDIIVNDAFLTRFPHEETKIIMMQIYKRLRLGGKYITTIRIGGNQGEAVVPSSDEKEMFISRAIKRSKELKVDFSDLMAQQAAQNYIENMISYSLLNDETLWQLCKDIFSIEYIDSAKVPGECVESEYRRVVFSKIY